MLSKDQQKLLKQLKQDLDSEERSVPAQVRGARSGEFVSSSIGGLFSRLATPDEGIEFRTPGGVVDAPLGLDDRGLFELALRADSTIEKIAIGFPNVAVGLSTWLAVSVMIARVAFRQTAAGTSAGHNAPGIVIACRERLARDLYLSQQIRFTGQVFNVARFPAYRVRRDGELYPICHAEAAKPNALSTPVIFYHFDKIDQVGGEIRVGLILAEISEVDSRVSGQLLERLDSLQSFLQRPRIILFFNSFDDGIRSRLRERGFRVLHMKPGGSASAQYGYPTLASAFSGYPYAQEVVPQVLEADAGISEALKDAAAALANVGNALSTPQGRGALSGWWSIWRTLKDLAIPLELYEHWRIRVQQRGALEETIARISQNGVRVEGADYTLLNSVAPTIGGRLRNLYGTLKEVNPKAERLQRYLGELASQATRATLVLLAEKSQAGLAAITDELLGVLRQVDVSETLSAGH